MNMLATEYPPLHLTVFFGVLVVVWAAISLAQRYRTISLASLAGQLKLRIFARDQRGIVQRYHRLYLFQRGQAHRARNVMIGHVAGKPIRAFDYFYETGLGLNRRTEQFTVVMVQAAKNLPALLIRPLDDKGEKCNLTGLAQASLAGTGYGAEYRAYCQKSDFVSSRIDAEVLSRLKQCGTASLELCEGTLALYRPGKIKGPQYRKLMEQAAELAEQLAGDSEQQPSDHP